MRLLSLKQVLKGGGCVEDHRSRKGQQAKGARGALDAHGSDKRHSAIAGFGGRNYLYRIMADGAHLRLGGSVAHGIQHHALNGTRDQKSRKLAEVQLDRSEA